MKHTLVHHGKRSVTINELYGWLANGAYTTHGKCRAGSAISRYAPFYAYGWVKYLKRGLPNATDEFFVSVCKMVATLVKKHYGTNMAGQIAATGMSGQDIVDTRHDLALFFINTWLPWCVNHCYDYTTLGDYAVFKFRKCLPAVLLSIDLQAHGIAGTWETDAISEHPYVITLTRTCKNAERIIAYVRWQKADNYDPLQWLRSHNYITDRTPLSSVNSLLTLWKRLAICAAAIPHTTKHTYSGGKAAKHGYTTADETEAFGVLDVTYTII